MFLVIAATSVISSMDCDSASSVQVVPLQVNSPKSAAASMVAVTSSTVRLVPEITRPVPVRSVR